MVRRVVVAASQGESWGFEGYAIPDLRGGDSLELEGAGDEPIEVFQGIGIIARPAAGDTAEALVFSVGAEAEHQVFGAVRNQAARARYVEEYGEPEPGEIAVFNSEGKTRILITAAGDVEITVEDGKEINLKSKSGAAAKLATLADVEGIRGDLNGHEHTYIAALHPGVATLTTLGPAVSAPVGTAVVKGE